MDEMMLSLSKVRVAQRLNRPRYRTLHLYDPQSDNVSVCVYPFED